MEDTIVAISTAVSGSAISIVRMSGKESISIIKKIFNAIKVDEINGFLKSVFRCPIVM